MENKQTLLFRILGIVILVAIVIVIGIVFPKKDVGKNTATLSWSANNESDLSGYRIYYGASPRIGDCPPAGYTEKVDVGKTASPEKPSYKIENLENGNTYYFSVTSYDTAGNESCFSSEMSKEILK